MDDAGGCGKPGRWVRCGLCETGRDGWRVLMSDQTSAALTTLSEHVSAIERDFLDLSKVLDKLDEPKGRTVILAAFRTVQRVAEAARPVRAACPRCGRPDSKMEYEA